jgi:hypothetical protein
VLVPCVQIFIKFQRTASNINDYGPSIKIAQNKVLIKSLLNILNHEFHISNIFFFLKKKKQIMGTKVIRKQDTMRVSFPIADPNRKYSAKNKNNK